MITYSQSSSIDDLAQILLLQQANLSSAISEEEKTTQGFVTVQHTFELLKTMHEQIPHTLAKKGNQVIGYALSMHPVFGNRIEVLKSMFEEINSFVDTPDAVPQQMRHDNYIVMGQVCIDKHYRKQGIFRKLYQYMQQFVAPEFSYIITEVDAQNTRSLEAHLAIGFKELKRYKADGQEWVLIYLQ